MRKETPAEHGEWRRTVSTFVVKLNSTNTMAKTDFNCSSEPVFDGGNLFLTSFTMETDSETRLIDRLDLVCSLQKKCLDLESETSSLQPLIDIILIDMAGI